MTGSAHAATNAGSYDGTTTRIQGLTYWTLLFAIFSAIGWVYEIVNHAVVFHEIQLRASLAGPWCPIYGVGGVLLVALLGNIARPSPTRGDHAKRVRGALELACRVALVAVLAWIVVTVVELLGAVVCEMTMGFVPWDYSDYAFNYRGWIAPAFTARFVVGGLAFIYIISPAVRRFVEQRPTTALRLAITFVSLFVVDCALEAAGVWSSLLADWRDGIAID